MPITPTYPGVYVEEIPSGVRTITGVGTSITAFIGRAQKGPVNEPTTINCFADYERFFGGLWEKSTMSYAVRDFYQNGGNKGIIVRLHNQGIATIIKLYSGSPPDPNRELRLEAANVGSWGNNLRACVNWETKDENDTKLFNLTIYIIDPETGKRITEEKFLNVYVDSAKARYLPKVLEQDSMLVRVAKNNEENYIIPDVRPDTAFNIEAQSPPLSPPISPPASPPATSDLGSDGVHLSDNQFIGSGLKSAKQGLYALEKADIFNLLCIPPYTSINGTSLALEDQPTDVSVIVISKAAQYCDKRRAMLLVDAPSNWDSKSDVVNGLNSITSQIGDYRKNAALFFPRLKQVNLQHDRQIEVFVPCGAVAGVFARTDANRGVWKSPAGQEASLVGISQLGVPLTDDENGELNPLGVNCLRSFPVFGHLIWGARTLDGDDRLTSEWKYTAVRRTALFIEESLYRGTQWVVFEPNDEPLWAQIRLNVGAFMHNLFRQGAFQGKTPREAYLVKCDKETTTQNDINQGVVNILVGFAPLKPAEFVFIKIQQLAGQIET